MNVWIGEEEYQNIFARMLALKTDRNGKRKTSTSILSVATRLFTGFHRRRAVNRKGISVCWSLSIISLLVCNNKAKRISGNWIFPHYVIRNIFSMCTFKSLDSFTFFSSRIRIRHTTFQITFRIFGTR